MLQNPRQSPLITARRGDCALIPLEGTQWPYLWKIKTFSSETRWLAGTLENRRAAARPQRRRTHVRIVYSVTSLFRRLNIMLALSHTCPLGKSLKAFSRSKIDFVHQNWYSNTHPWSVKHETDIMCFGMDEIDQSFSMTARSSGSCIRQHL